MRVAEVEKQTGVDRHTLRYYERRGLLRGIRRGANNYRDYAAETVRQITLLRQLQSLGFSLQEIGEILEAMHAGDMDCEEGARLMQRKRRSVSAQLKRLRSLDRMLAHEQQRLEESAARQRESAACEASPPPGRGVAAS